MEGGGYAIQVVSFSRRGWQSKIVFGSVWWVEKGKEKRCRQAAHSWCLSNISVSCRHMCLFISWQSSLITCIGEMLVLCESPSRSVTHRPSCQPPGSYSFLIFLRALWSSPSVSSTANPLHCNPQMFHSLISLVLRSHPSRHYRCTHIFVITKSKPPAPTFLLRSGHGSPPDQVDSSAWVLGTSLNMSRCELRSSPSDLLFFGKLEPILPFPWVLLLSPNLKSSHLVCFPD